MPAVCRSCACSPPCAQICVTVDGCGSPTQIPVLGATVTITLGSTVIGTAITGQSVSSITVSTHGSGYTSAPTVTLSGGGGSGAVATVNLFSGIVSSITVNYGGSGYTSAPTVAISGGGGSGAAAVSVLGTTACIPISSTGTYTISAAPPSGTYWSSTPATSSVTVPSCAGTITKSLVLSAASGFSCLCEDCRDPVPTYLFLTDANGTWMSAAGTVSPGLPGGATGSGWVVCYTSGGMTVSYIIQCFEYYTLTGFYCPASPTNCSGPGAAFGTGSCTGTPPFMNCPGGGPDPEGGCNTTNYGSSPFGVAPNNCNTGGSFSLTFNITSTFGGLLTGTVTVTG